MTASSIQDFKISEFMLAFLEGTGWYKGNYSMTEPVHWGRNKGCDFYYGPCLDTVNSESKFEEFCPALTEVGCSASRKSGAKCGGNSIETDSTVPGYFNYWGNDTIISDVFADNCPYFTASDVKDCIDPSQQVKAFLSGELYGDSSRCFTGTIFGSRALPSKTTYCFQSDVKLLMSPISKIFSAKRFQARIM